jgi:ribosomal protein L40E
MDDRVTCSKCGFRTPEPVTKCAQCGTRLVSPKRIRRLGKVSATLGALLTVIGIGLGGLVAWAVSRSPPGAHVRVGIDKIYGIFLIVIVFGLVNVVAGVRQARTGKSSRAVLFTIAVLAVAIFFLASSYVKP